MPRATLAVMTTTAALAACRTKPPPTPPTATSPVVSNTAAAEPAAGGDGYGGVAYGGSGYGLLGYDDPPPPAPEDVDPTGRWVGDCVASARGDYHQTTYNIDETQWDRRSDVFADAACTQRRWSLHVVSTYVVNRRSDAVADSFEISMIEVGRDVVADDKKTAAALGKPCRLKLKPGVATSIYATKCAAYGARLPDDMCSEYDLVSVGGGAIQTGLIPAGADRCATHDYPTALAQDALFARWQPFGIAECDALGAGYEKLASCPSIPADQRQQMTEALRIINQSLREAGRGGGTADACKAALATLESTIRTVGC